jgi:hypothetical protein
MYRIVPEPVKKFKLNFIRSSGNALNLSVLPLFRDFAEGDPQIGQLKLDSYLFCDP